MKYFLFYNVWRRFWFEINDRKSVGTNVRYLNVSRSNYNPKLYFPPSGLTFVVYFNGVKNVIKQSAFLVMDSKES